MRYIDKVGIELEGGWNNAIDLNIIGDGSVNVRAEIIGELVSYPMTEEKVYDWVIKNHPPAVNATCGMHVHVSFTKILYYAKLMDPLFQGLLLERLTTWGKENKIRSSHPFWERVEGNNTFCRPNFWPERQYLKREKHGERYTMLNYTWARYRTIECRILPAFKNPNISVSAIKCVLDSFKEFLKLVNKRRETEKKLVLEENNSEVVFEDTLKISSEYLKPVLYTI